MTRQFGDKIISHFTNPARGPLTGQNDHGVEVEFVLVSVEEESFWDNSVESMRANNRFELAGIDLAPNRRDDIRASFAHFRGEESTPEPGSLPFRDRRRMVILNLVANAVDLAPLEILYNDTPEDSGAISAGAELRLKAAINRVEPGVSMPDNDGDGDPDSSDPDDDNDGLRDEDEIALGLDPLHADTDGNGTPDGEEDPDRDRYSNAEELNILQTDPLDGTSRFDFMVNANAEGHSISFSTLEGRRYVVECSSDGSEFEEVVTMMGSGTMVDPQLGPIEGVQLYRVLIELAEP